MLKMTVDASKSEHREGLNYVQDLRWHHGEPRLASELGPFCKVSNAIKNKLKLNINWFNYPKTKECQGHRTCLLSILQKNNMQYLMNLLYTMSP